MYGVSKSRPHQEESTHLIFDLAEAEFDSLTHSYFS